MGVPIFIAELMWLTMFCEVSGTQLLCRIKDGSKRVDCSVTKNIQKIGPDLWLPKKVSASAVETLDISGNHYDSADCNDLTHLLQFNAKNITFVGRNARNNFKTCLIKLKTVEEMNLSNTVGLGPNLTGVAWPKKLIHLTMVKMNLTAIVGLDKLDALQELDLSSNLLTAFPKLNQSAPILLIHLRKNKIKNITVENIAAYCEMASFSVPEVMNDATNYKYCAPLQEWVKKFSIDTFETLSCQVPTSGNVTKKFNFSEAAMKARNTCLNALPGTGIWDILFFAVFFSILFPLLYYGNEAYNSYQAKKLEKVEKPVKRRRRRTTTTAAPVSDFEGDRTEGDSSSAEHDES